MPIDEQQTTFESEWPELARYVHNLLGCKGIYGPLREDILQETALRLFQMWDRVDRSRPLKALVATVALNLLRDEARKKHDREVLGEVPERPAENDVEHMGLARIELQRVGRAMTRLSPDHRLVLLHEVREQEGPALRGQAAMKMLRMRARRRLTTILEASAVAVAAFVARARKVSGAETAVALTAAVIAVGGGPWIGGATPGDRPPEGSSRPSQPAVGRLQDARAGKARSEGTARTAVAGQSTAPVIVPSTSGTADARAVDPVTVPVGNGEVRASGEIKVNGASVAVGENGGPLPACVNGVPGLPSPVSCGGGRSR